MIAGIGGWVAALIIGLLLVWLGPLAPEPFGYILRVIGYICLVIAVILLAFWLIGLVTGAAVIGAALPLLV